MADLMIQVEVVVACTSDIDGRDAGVLSKEAAQRRLNAVTIEQSAAVVQIRGKLSDVYSTDSGQRARPPFEAYLAFAPLSLVGTGWYKMVQDFSSPQRDWRETGKRTVGGPGFSGIPLL